MPTPTEDMPTVSAPTGGMPTISSPTRSTTPPPTPSGQYALEQRISRLESATRSQTRLRETIISTITRIEDQISSQTYEAINNVLSETFNIFDENRYIEKDIYEKKAALARNFEIFEARQQVVSTWEQQLKERGAKLDEREQKLALREHDVRRGEEALKAESVRARRYKEELKKTMIELNNEKGPGARRLSEETEEERMRLLDVAMEMIKKEMEAELQSEQKAEMRALDNARRAVEETLKRQGQERSQFWGLQKRKADDME